MQLIHDCRDCTDVGFLVVDHSKGVERYAYRNPHADLLIAGHKHAEDIVSMQQSINAYMKSRCCRPSTRGDKVISRGTRKMDQ